MSSNTELNLEHKQTVFIQNLWKMNLFKFPSTINLEQASNLCPGPHENRTEDWSKKIMLTFLLESITISKLINKLYRN